MPNYQNGKIYKITGGGLTYIGSTTQSLSKRLAEHRNDYKTCEKTGEKTKITSFYILEHISYEITLVEDYPCGRKEQLNMRERYFIENTNCVNKVIPMRTRQEYLEANKDKISLIRQEYNENNKDKIKQYYADNKEAIRAKQQVYEDNNKEKKNIYTTKYLTDNADKRKSTCSSYYQKNKDKIKDYQQAYYQKNRDSISIRNKLYIDKQEKCKFSCKCGSIINKLHLSRHIRSIKHQKFITLQNEQGQEDALIKQT